MIRHSNKVYHMKAEKIKTKKEDFSIRPSPFTDSVTIYLKELGTKLNLLNNSRNKMFFKVNKDFKETNELVSLVRSAYKIIESLHPSEQIDRNNRKSILFIFKKMIISQEHYSLTQNEIIIIKSILILYNVDVKDICKSKPEVIF